MIFDLVRRIYFAPGPVWDVFPPMPYVVSSVASPSPATTWGPTHGAHTVYSHNGDTVTHVHRLPRINQCDRQVPQVLSKRSVCHTSRWGCNLRGGPQACLMLATVHCSCLSHCIYTGGKNIFSTFRGFNLSKKIHQSHLPPGSFVVPAPLSSL